MEIGSIKKHLSLAKETTGVRFDFCDCVPTTIESWRGRYDEPAIGWVATNYSGEGKTKTVKEFLEELELAVSGKEYHGWKGGQYTYNDRDILHVDNPGDCSNTEIYAVTVNEYYVTLLTRKED